MKMKQKMTMENRKKAEQFMIYMQFPIILVVLEEDITQLMRKIKYIFILFLVQLEVVQF